MILRIAQDAAQTDKKHWRWSVWLEGPDDELALVKEVVWKLHSSFTQPIRRVSTRRNGFRLDSGGWGEFEIQAEIHLLKDQVEHLRHWIRFDRESLNRGSRSEMLDDYDLWFGRSRARQPQSIFLSYSRQDARLAGYVARKLTRSGIRVLLDVDIPPGVEVRRWIGETIESSDAVIFVGLDDASFAEFSTYALDYATELSYAAAAGAPRIVVAMSELPPDFLSAYHRFELVLAKKSFDPEFTAEYIVGRIYNILSDRVDAFGRMIPSRVPMPGGFRPGGEVLGGDLGFSKGRPTRD